MILKKIRDIIKTDIFKSVAALFSGTAISQFIPLMAAPVVSRIYNEQDFAVFADYISILNIFTVIATGKFSYAIVTSKSEKEVSALFRLSILVSALVSLISLLFIVLFRHQISELLSKPHLSVWLLLVPFGVFFFGLFETLSYVFNRREKFKNIAAAKITRAISIDGTKVGLGFVFLQKTGLIIGHTLGDLFGTSVLFFINLKKNLQLFRKSSLRDIKYVLGRYKEFPLILGSESLIRMIRESGVILIISFFYEDTVSGSYFFGFKYARAPVMLLTYAVFQVFFNHFSKKKNAGKKLGPSFKNLFRISLLMGGGIFVAFIFAEFLFSIAFGEKWSSAGYYVSLLAPMLAINVVSGIFAFISMVLEIQREYFKVSLLYNLLVPATVFWSAYTKQDIETTIIVQSFIGSCTLLFTVFWYYKQIKKYDFKLNK